MSELVPGDDIPQDSEAFLGYLVNLVERGRRVAAVQVNAALTLTYWLVGRAISVNTLRNGRADYGREILASLGQELGARFGAGFDQSNLSRMVTFARLFPDYDRVSELARQLSWTHVKSLVAIKSEAARAFYAEEAAAKHLSVRELRAAIERKAYERREIANSQIPDGSAVPRDTFRDPLILDALGLREVGRDLPGRQTSGLQRQHDLINLVQPPLSFLHDHRLERAVPVPGHVQLDVAGGMGQDRLGPGPVTDIGRLPALGGMVLGMTQMLGHLLVQRRLQHAIGELLQQPVRARQRQALLFGEPDQLPGRNVLAEGSGFFLAVMLLSVVVITAPSPPTCVSTLGRKHL